MRARIPAACGALIVTASFLLAACGGGGGGGSTPPVVPTAVPTKTATPGPTSTPTLNPQAFICPSTGAPNSAVRLASSGRGEATTRRVYKRAPLSAAKPGTTLLAVTYNRATATSNARLIAGRETAAGANLVQTYDYPGQNIALRVVSVPTAQVQQAESSLRAQAGVQSIAATGERRYRNSTGPVWTNDPYFQGFLTFNKVLPFAQNQNIPGQWDMHVIGLEHAYGYSVAGTGYTANAAALGSSSIKIAIIDTGEDASHPELASKIVGQKCFVTNDAGTTQSTGNFATDQDGHGTDVAGIAADAINNSLGFSGAGGNSAIFAYRVFPTPDDTCANEATSDDQCSSATQDIASAINDAVAQHVNVISMSIGGGSCDSSGNDSDPVEGAAVANAIKNNVIVVAASGNSGPTPVGLTAPGCDTGVIAVGATSLDDGSPTGTTDTGTYSSSLTSAASVNNPVEYVASYSQYGGAAAVRSATAWGIVAPGGDPANAESSGTANDLHWIENIWTSTPFIGFPGDTNFTGNCTNDYPNTGSLSTNPDCRTLIAGTSMATPHVAGAAALILAVNASYQNPALMKQLLCQTADNISDSHQGCGRLNVYNAMAVAIGDTAKPTPIP